MTTTVTGTVAKRDKADQLVAWLRGQQPELAMAAASHIKPSTIVRVTQGALRKDEKLMAAAIANPVSLLHCLLDAARLGHEPGTDQYYLVPFGQEVTGIEGYKGIIERMFRAGAVSAVVAEVVRARDAFRPQGATTPPIHEYDVFADPDSRGELRGAYAYAVMLDGACSHVIPMGRAEIMKHKAKSRGSDRADSPWQQWEAAMWKKTPLRGLEPYVPTSSEWLKARAEAAASAGRPVVASGWNPPRQPAVAEPPDVVDADVVEDTEDSPPAQSPPTRGRAGGARRKAGNGNGDIAGVIIAHFERLGITDREERLVWTGKLARWEKAPTSTNDLTEEQKKGVLEALVHIRDIGQLHDLTSTGEAPEGSDDSHDL